MPRRSTASTELSPLAHRGGLALAGAAAAGLCAYGGILALGPALPVAVAVNFATLVTAGALVLVAVMAFWPPLAPPPRWCGFAGIIAIFVLFALALAAKWAVGVSSDVTLGGLLPASDAYGYLRGADSVRHGGTLDVWASRRPLASLQLAGLLGLTSDNLALAIAVLVGLNAAAMAAFVTAMGRGFGAPGAVLATAVLFPFYWPTMANTMSENIGFALGCAAFAIIWQAGRGKRPVLFAAGLALLTLGLLARAGAFFVLPALVLWAGWWFRGGARFSWRWAGAAALGVIAGFAVSVLATKLFAAPGQIPFANFAYTFYGLATNAENWTTIFADHPELRNFPEHQMAREAYRLAFAAIADDPLRLAQGVLGQYNWFLFNAGWHRFIDNHALRAVVILLTVIGIYGAVRDRRSAEGSLLIAATAGVLASVPLLGDGGTRVYAATAPMTAALAVYGLKLGLQWLKRPAAGAPSAPSAGQGLIMAALVLGTIIVAPVLLIQRDTTAGSLQGALDKARETCKAPDRVIAGRNPSTAAIWLVAGGEMPAPPGIHVVNIKDLVASKTNVSKLFQALAAVPLPAQLWTVTEAKSRRQLWLVAGDLSIAPSRGSFAACGNMGDVLFRVRTLHRPN